MRYTHQVRRDGNPVELLQLRNLPSAWRKEAVEDCPRASRGHESLLRREGPPATFGPLIHELEPGARRSLPERECDDEGFVNRVVKHVHPLTFRDGTSRQA